MIKKCGGFSNVGKGTSEGDGKDRAMRSIADSAIVEIHDDEPSSSKTTLEALGAYSGSVGETVMLARSNGLARSPLRPSTIQAIKTAHCNGCRFVVGDMPGVDEPFVALLKSLGAHVTIYHAGVTPRIDVETS